MKSINARLGPKAGTAGAQKKKPYGRKTTKDMDQKWQHDLFPGTQRKGGLAGVSILGKSLGQQTQVKVQNLHPAASKADVQVCV